MDYIQKLPYILSLSMGIIIGILSQLTGSETSHIYIKMAIGMITFYVFGIYIRSVLETIKKQVQQKIKQQEMHAKENEKQINSSPVIDYRVDDDEEFSPLKVSEVLKTNMD